jgi:hypothetical protein
MARKPRVKYSGAFYHVICRGNQRQVTPRANRYFLPGYVWPIKYRFLFY